MYKFSFSGVWHSGNGQICYTHIQGHESNFWIGMETVGYEKEKNLLRVRI